MIGVAASPHRVEAQLVAMTPFGRMRSGGRRVVEDVDGPVDSLPLSTERQLVDGVLATDEVRAGHAWVESVANSIAKLAFGLRGSKPRIGLCLDAPGSAARAAGFVADLEGALQRRSMDLALPIGRALTPGEACTLGEMHSALGGLAGVADAVALIWESDVHWARVAGGQIAQSASEPHGGGLDFGLHQLDECYRLPGNSSKRLFVAARQSEPRACELLRSSARALGLEAARRLVDWPLETEFAAPPTRLLLGGLVGRLASDPRLRGVLLEPLQEGLAQGLLDRGEAARSLGLIVSDEDRRRSGNLSIAPGLVQISQEDSAAVIGAASTVAPAAQPHS